MPNIRLNTPERVEEVVATEELSGGYSSTGAITVEAKVKVARRNFTLSEATNRTITAISGGTPDIIWGYITNTSGSQRTFTFPQLATHFMSDGLSDALLLDDDDIYEYSMVNYGGSIGIVWTYAKRSEAANNT